MEFCHVRVNLFWDAAREWDNAREQDHDKLEKRLSEKDTWMNASDWGTDWCELSTDHKHDYKQRYAP